MTTSGFRGVLYLLEEQRQELDELVGGQYLHVGLHEGVQVLVFGLSGGRMIVVKL